MQVAATVPVIAEVPTPVSAEVSAEVKWMESHKKIIGKGVKAIGPLDLTIIGQASSGEPMIDLIIGATFPLFSKVVLSIYKPMEPDRVVALYINDRLADFSPATNLVEEIRSRVYSYLHAVLQAKTVPQAKRVQFYLPYDVCKQVLAQVEPYRDAKTALLPEVQLSTMTLDMFRKNALSTNDPDALIAMSKWKDLKDPSGRWEGPSAKMVSMPNVDWLCKAYELCSEEELDQLVDVRKYFPEDDSIPLPRRVVRHSQVFAPHCKPIATFLQKLPSPIGIDLVLTEPASFELFSDIGNFMQGAKAIHSIKFHFEGPGNKRMLKKAEVAALAHAIVASKTLEEIEFKGFAIPEESFDLLLSAISETQAPIAALVFDNCSAAKLVKRFQVFIQNNRGIIYASMEGAKGAKEGSLDYISPDDEEKVYDLAQENRPS
ncbi:MAG: hypothetical protein SP4CHLAM5_00140 [Chlamydiia bacterium]|nr:hypothetical protein [Chlamydiia bacterium]MCH9617893.1 hypothetical protein [Chlamydiia bacterium]MCH9624109.1 hypothetical protein [Chlamydiia bacterium]